jgi:hypothetical protein
MVGQVSGTGHMTQWACMAASAMAADRIFMFLMVQK